MIDNKEIFVEDKEETKAEEANTYASSLGMFGSETSSPPVSIGGYVENEEQSKEFLDAIAGTFLTILVSVFLAPFIISVIIMAIAIPTLIINNIKYKKLLEKLDERQKNIVNKMVLDIRNYLVWKETVKYNETFKEIIKYLKQIQKKYKFNLSIDEKELKMDPKSVSDRYKQKIDRQSLLVRNIVKTVVAKNVTKMEEVNNDDNVGFEVITLIFNDSGIDRDKADEIIKPIIDDIIIILENMNKKYKSFNGEILNFEHEFKTKSIEDEYILTYIVNNNILTLSLETNEFACLKEPLPEK